MAKKVWQIDRAFQSLAILQSAVPAEEVIDLGADP